MLKSFIEQLSKDLELSQPIAPVEEGHFLLNFGPKLQISLRENSDSGITLLTRLAPIPVNDVDEFFLVLMKANLLGKETGGGVLGLEKDEKMVTFGQFLLPTLSYKEFHDAIEDYVNYAESWQSATIDFQPEKGT